MKFKWFDDYPEPLPPPPVRKVRIVLNDTEAKALAFLAEIGLERAQTMTIFKDHYLRGDREVRNLLKGLRGENINE